MPFQSFQVPDLRLRGLLAIAVLGLCIYLLKYWYDHRYHEVVTGPTAIYEPVGRDRGRDRRKWHPVVVRREQWHLGDNRETAALVGALALLALSLGRGVGRLSSSAQAE